MFKAACGDPVPFENRPGPGGQRDQGDQVYLYSPGMAGVGLGSDGGVVVCLRSVVAGKMGMGWALKRQIPGEGGMAVVVVMRAFHAVC